MPHCHSSADLHQKKRIFRPFNWMEETNAERIDYLVERLQSWRKIREFRKSPNDLA